MGLKEQNQQFILRLTFLKLGNVYGSRRKLSCGLMAPTTAGRLLLTSAPTKGISYWKEAIHLRSELEIVPQVFV